MPAFKANSVFQMGYQKLSKSFLEELDRIIFSDGIASRKLFLHATDLPAYEHVEAQPLRWRLHLAETRPLLRRGWHQLQFDCP